MTTIRTLLVTFLVISALVLPLAPRAASASVSFTLKAIQAGWNLGEPGGANPTLTVNAGDTVTVTIEWVDSVHNWALYPPGTTDAGVSLGSPNALERTNLVSGPGETSSVTFTITQPGTYEYFCEIHPVSMHGQLVVSGTPGDTSPPVVSAVLATPSSQVPAGAVNVTATITDDTGVAAASAHVVGPGFNQNLTLTRVGASTWFVNRTYAAAGTYAVTVWASDASGNVGSGAAGFDIVAQGDVTPPAVTNPDATPSIQEVGGAVNITATITDGTSVTSARAHVLGPSVDENLTMTRLGTSTWYVNRTFQNVGGYAFTIWATDAAGNVGSAGGAFAVVFAQDGPAPPVSPLVFAVFGAVLAVVIAVGAAVALRRRKGPKPRM
ncbi:MAG: plastocyanin/azurin family copper-binding protein [Methanobacteriota archaeon]